MAKRFTATEKWEDSWFRKLDSKHKLLWIYMLDRCDIAGFWERDFDLAGYFTGCKYDEGDVLEKFKSRVVLVNGKLFIPKFIEFQYSKKFDELSEDSPVHRSIIKLLNRYPKDILMIPYQYPIETLHSRVKDKDKDKDKDKVNSVDFLKKRCDAFIGEVNEVVKDFTTEQKEIILGSPKIAKSFIQHWCEPNQAKTKMRFELEKTWSLKGRISTWLKNADKFEPKKYKTNEHIEIPKVRYTNSSINKQPKSIGQIFGEMANGK